jgi:hypothetical protein
LLLVVFKNTLILKNKAKISGATGRHSVVLKNCLFKYGRSSAEKKRKQKAPEQAPERLMLPSWQQFLGTFSGSSFTRKS